MTTRQKDAAQKMVENGGNASRAMRDAGYSPATAKTPSKLTASKGFRQVMDDCGLTDELLISALVDDIKSKKGNRRAELELAFKLKGRFSRLAETDDRPMVPIQVIDLGGL